MAAHEIQQPLTALSPPPQTYQSHMPPPSRPPPTYSWTTYQNPLPASPQQPAAPDSPLNYSINPAPLNFSSSSDRHALLESMKRKVFEMEERESLELICNLCPEYEKQNVDLQGKIAQLEKCNEQLNMNNNALLCEMLKLQAFKSKINAKLLNIPHSSTPNPSERQKIQTPIVSTPSQYVPAQQHHVQHLSTAQVPAAPQPQFTPQQYQQLSNQHMMPSQQLATSISTQQHSSPHFPASHQPAPQATYIPSPQYISSQQQSWMPPQEQELMPPPPLHQ